MVYRKDTEDTESKTPGSWLEFGVLGHKHQEQRFRIQVGDDFQIQVGLPLWPSCLCGKFHVSRPKASLGLCGENPG
jgi:hypothetical protein